MQSPNQAGDFQNEFMLETLTVSFCLGKSDFNLEKVESESEPETSRQAAQMWGSSLLKLQEPRAVSVATQKRR